MDRQKPGRWLPSPEVRNPTPVVTAPETLRKVLDAAPPDFAAFLRLVAVTGMLSGGEAAPLRRSDVDMGAGVIRKARAISQGVERDTKTGAGYALALDAGTIEVLSDHMRARHGRATSPSSTSSWRPAASFSRMSRTARSRGALTAFRSALSACAIGSA